jgi:Zn-dependent peptidase ImmA (M78 family)/transcriptional regulator with XRE-family HTH domain
MHPEAGFQAGNLRLARLLSGWTKAELAERLQVSRQFVHALEIGGKSPSADMLAALSLLLKVQPSFWCTPLTGEVREEECHFRSRRSMPDKLAEQIVAHGTALEMIVRFLDAKLTLPKVNFPSIEANSVLDIERAAEQCRMHWDLGFGPIANMCRVLENAGAVITLFKSDRHEVDALSISRARPIVVRNTAKQSPGRLRFDLAHECGHLVIHQGIETGDKETEEQANIFSAAFLLPSDTFRKEFPTMHGRLDWHVIYSLKVRWRVSAKAILRRARDLTLLNDVQYAAGNRFLNQSGQARIEQYDERIPMEDPELVGTAIQTYLNSFSATLGDLANRIGMTPALLSQLLPTRGYAAPD